MRGGSSRNPTADALKWALLLRGVRFIIIQSLGKLIVDSGRPESERSLAAVLVLHRFSGTNEVPLRRQLDFTLEAEGRPYAILSPIVMARGRATEALVRKELDQKPDNPADARPSGATAGSRGRAAPPVGGMGQSARAAGPERARSRPTASGPCSETARTLGCTYCGPI